ncbi:MAG: hypothetical protein WDO13_19880 [Verrucomicrobiota bacterium]
MRDDDQRIVCLLALAAGVVARAADTPPMSGEEMILKVAAHDKVLVERRKGFDYDIAITRDQLRPDNSVASTASDKVTMRGNVAPSYTRAPTSRRREAKQQSREEPFELLHILDHYTYKVEGSETVNGVDCWRIAFTPKPDMPYDNREEKVLNNVAATFGPPRPTTRSSATRARCSGRSRWRGSSPRCTRWTSISTPRACPTATYGPGRLQYRYLVNIPFMQLHERDTRCDVKLSSARGRADASN